MVPKVLLQTADINPEVRYEILENDDPDVRSRGCFFQCIAGFLAARARPRPLRSAGRLEICGEVSVPQDRRAARQARQHPDQSCRKTAQLASSGITQGQLPSPMPSYECAPG